jgi:hypothetical protein
MEKLEMEFKRPTYSPWGKMQTCRRIIPGVYTVTTPGHGGLLVHESVYKKLTPYTQSAGIPSDEYYGYEEDCDYALIAFELKLEQFNISDTLYSLCNWHTKYVSQPEIKMLLSPEQLTRLQERKNEAAEDLEKSELVRNGNPDLVVAASSLTCLSDYVRVFRLQEVTSINSLIESLKTHGQVFDADAISNSTEGVGKLVAVWTADDKLHIIDDYPGVRKTITRLQDCGRTVFAGS